MRSLRHLYSLRQALLRVELQCQNPGGLFELPAMRARMTGASRVVHLCSTRRALLEAQGRDMPVVGDVFG